MIDKVLENNQVEIVGIVDSEFVYSHEIYGEAFYLVEILVQRMSQIADRIPLMVSERLIDVQKDYRGVVLKVKGQFRSHNKHEDGHNRLVLSVFVRELEIVRDDMGENLPNSIRLDGYICKQPVYRTTPLGREIADMILAVNRAYGKSDYLPCICWGRNARFAGRFEVGTHIHLWGRIQSRTYHKHRGNEDVEQRTAYEISVNKLECIQ